MTSTVINGCNVLGICLFLAFWGVFVYGVAPLNAASPGLARAAVTALCALAVALDLGWRYTAEPGDSMWRFVWPSTGGAIVFVPMWLVFPALCAFVVFERLAAL